MNNLTFKLVLLAAGILAASLLLTSCDNDDDENTPKDVVYGQFAPMGNGQARSFIRLDGNGSPTAIGFTFNKEALEGLPHEEKSFELDLPAGKEQLPYDHISVDWAPHGHEPAPIYNVGHFDMHFYMLSKADRATIQPGPLMEKLPEKEFLPATYFTQPGEGILSMGKHWVDATAPELHGKSFTTTFIYGSFNGQIVFHEPMITRNYLLTQPDTVMNIPQPTAFLGKGLHYPTNYSVRFDSQTNVYTISLENLTLR